MSRQGHRTYGGVFAVGEGGHELLAPLPICVLQEAVRWFDGVSPAAAVDTRLS